MLQHQPPPPCSPHRRPFSLTDAQRVYQLAQRSTRLGTQTRAALAIIDQALDDYGHVSVALSFNGGKDCTVLVHLLAAAILRHLHPAHFPTSSARSPPSSSSSSSSPASITLPPIPTVYVRCPSPFPQVEAFVTLCATWYHLSLSAVEGGMKLALQSYLDAHAHSHPAKPVKAILVGVRRNDPHGAQLTPFAPTDAGWPDFVRVHPVLDWSYGDVWDFLRSEELSLGASGEEGEGGDDQRGLEWCELYDYGYTSLGSTHNTFPNPLLRATTSRLVPDADAAAAASGEDEAHGQGRPLGGWRPAWELEDESAERAGRETDLSAILARQPQHNSNPTSPAASHAAAGANGSAAAKNGAEKGAADAADGETPLGSNPPSRAGSPHPSRGA
ncbi:hypothetical protein Rhopal_000028-T1 [Rhodotorula paludigena]|uniref:FAD synthase n=1 Tax=Rhodotorula paludigena TaxID=86838 RepID=A0AAV5GEK6_9BASI|nr:hypothetical protein Rhopal_000028-T1 [Rhodotorula paludigena]